jgi:hypothetical protein
MGGLVLITSPDRPFGGGEVSAKVDKKAIRAVIDDGPASV